MPNGLEMSRLAGEGRAAWAETSCTGSRPRPRASLKSRIRSQAGQCQSAAAGNGTRQARSAPSSCWTPSTCFFEREIQCWRAPCAGRVREQGARLLGGQRVSIEEPD